MASTAPNPNEPGGLQPARALAHPLWWGALALMAVNDQLVKGAELLPQPLVGKLSDFAGLLFAPVLLAALLRVRTGRGLLAAHLVVGAVFAGINVSPDFAQGFAALTALTPWPWHIYVDPSDLAALPMLLLSWRIFRPRSARPVAVRPALARAGLALGSLACVATSPPPGPEPGPMGQRPLVFPDVNAALVVVNQTEAQQILRVRPLRPEVALDCPAIEHPPTALDRDLFAPATVWLLEPGRALGIGPAAGACGAWLVDGANLDARIVFFQRDDWPVTALPSTDAAPDDRALRLLDGPDGVAWSTHPALFGPPIDPESRPEPVCAQPPAGAGLSWTTPPVGERELVGLRPGADGCVAFGLRDPAAPEDRRDERWYLCAGGAALPFAEGETLRIEPTFGDGEGVRVEGRGGWLEARRGAASPLGGGLTELAGCEAFGDRCGGRVQSLSIDVRGRPLRAGESVELDEGDRLYLLRAQRSLVVDHACDPDAFVGAPLVETVRVGTPDSNPNPETRE